MASAGKGHLISLIINIPLYNYFLSVLYSDAGCSLHHSTDKHGHDRWIKLKDFRKFDRFLFSVFRICVHCGSHYYREVYNTQAASQGGRFARFYDPHGRFCFTVPVEGEVFDILHHFLFRLLQLRQVLRADCGC